MEPLPANLERRIEDLMRETNMSRDDVINGLLNFALDCGALSKHRDLMLRYAEILRDPAQKRWADVILTVLDRTIPPK